MPFWIEKLSVSSPACSSPLSPQGLPKSPVTEKSFEKGMLVSRKAFTISAVCCWKEKPDLMLNTPCSEYYSVRSFNKMLVNSDAKSFSILHCNIRSLSKNPNLLEELLRSLDSKLDILGITETKGLFTWRWGTPGRWGNPLRLGKTITLLYMQSYNPAIPGCTFSRLLNGRSVLKQENAGKPRVLAINALLLQPSVLWLSIVTFTVLFTNTRTLKLVGRLHNCVSRCCQS